MQSNANEQLWIPNRAGGSPELVEPASLNLRQELTVEAWVDCRDASSEGMQVLAGQWLPPDDWGSFKAFDAGTTGGMDTTGFFGAVFDGRYVYFVPQHDLRTRHGKVLRYDTHAPFDDRQSWSAYDAGQTGGLNTKGYYGAVFDGRYVIFVPRRDAEGFHTRVLRYDTHGSFDDSRSWTAHDRGMARSYQSAAFDGRYVYLCPGHVAVHKSQLTKPSDFASPPVTGMDPNYQLLGNSIVLRYDTQSEFDRSESWQQFDAAETDGLDTCDYDGACFDGRYVYFVPLSTGAVLRYDTRASFDKPTAWNAFDARPLGMRLCVGAAFDGRYVYFVPYGQSESAVRYDTKGPFDHPASWTAYTLSQTRGLPTRGFDGAMFDGRYVYYVPYYDGESYFHGYLLRYDTQGDYLDPKSWRSIDAGRVDGLSTIGFNAGASDGRFLYFAPWNDGCAYPKAIVGNGRVLRYDTLGSNGSFSLRYVDYGHNGGLCAAVPGSRFLVNTTQGVRSIAANRPPVPGRHYLTGTYDGKSIRLFFDGMLVNEQSASGEIQSCDTDVSVGQLFGGTARFRGTIEAIRLADTARTAAWIRQQFDHWRSAPPGGLFR